MSKLIFRALVAPGLLAAFMLSAGCTSKNVANDPVKWSFVSGDGSWDSGSRKWTVDIGTGEAKTATLQLQNTGSEDILVLVVAAAEDIVGVAIQSYSIVVGDNGIGIPAGKSAQLTLTATARINIGSPRKFVIDCAGSTTEPTANAIGPDRLDRANPYLIVGEGNLANDDPSRSATLWFITADNTDGFAEHAQTAVQAAVDLYRLYGNTFTAVLLVPRVGVRTPYADVSYASDGKGASGMTGSAQAKPGYWHASAIDDLPYNAQELAILELWQQKQGDFPSRDPVSSLSYDETALRQYIADTLQLPYSETKVRQLKTREYLLPDEPVVRANSDRMPPSEAALQGIPSPYRFTVAERDTIDSLAAGAPEDVRGQLASKYEAAESVSKDSRWMVFSSWRPYTQSSEYQQLLEFCQKQGRAVWPLLFQQLESDNPGFAGGVILDSTIPEYLHYFERAGNLNATPAAGRDFSAYITELLQLQR